MSNQNCCPLCHANTKTMIDTRLGWTCASCAKEIEGPSRKRLWAFRVSLMLIVPLFMLCMWTITQTQNEALFWTTLSAASANAMFMVFIDPR